MYVISLSTIPPRFSTMGPTLELLVQQDPKPDAVILYLPKRYRRFPDWDGTLPDVPKGVEIRQVDEDFGPASKLLHALREFEDEAVDILFCDDDMNYRQGWARAFLNERQRHPNACIALSGIQISAFHDAAASNEFIPKAGRHWRATDPEFALRKWWTERQADNPAYPVISPGRRPYWRAGHADVFEGYAGVMVRPEFFPEQVFDIPEVARQVDDIWLSGMATAHGTPIRVPAWVREPDVLKVAHQNALHLTIIEGRDQDDHNRRAIEYMQENYGLWQ
ncbi:glycosyltransferase family 2 protein [Shimia sp.]|uniref:glycosyltransferase family 2 protein n=1 Tax=Shimia sp. TaxID=1954381 RepID=UPI00329864DE